MQGFSSVGSFCFVSFCWVLWKNRDRFSLSRLFLPYYAMVSSIFMETS